MYVTFSKVFAASWGATGLWLYAPYLVRHGQLVGAGIVAATGLAGFLCGVLVSGRGSEET